MWQFAGYVGHIFFRKSPPRIKGSERVLINLGCGETFHKDWINADFYRLQNYIFKRHLRPNWMLDLTKPLKCESNFVDAVFMEHTNEHLLYSENYKLISEIYRILKEGGVLRICVPDLNKYLNWEVEKINSIKMARFSSLPEAISSLTQNHLHKSVWNAELLIELLTELGFKQVYTSKFNSSKFDHLKIDDISHEWESVYVEAIK